MYKVITIPETDFWDEKNEEFVYVPETKIKLMHSLVSISKWESKWHKAFLGKKEKTPEEIIDYVRCMTVTQNVNECTYLALNDKILEEVLAYIEDSMSASVVPDMDEIGPKNKDTPTSEYLYCCMFANGIPIECEKWHLNRLLNLIKICGVMNSRANGNNKIPRAANARRYAKMNTARRAARHSKG